MVVRTAQAPLVEQRAIEYILAEERHGRPSTLLTIWFASNAQITTVATGLLATVVFGLSLQWAIISILIGNLVGCLFTAGPVVAQQAARRWPYVPRLMPI